MSECLEGPQYFETLVQPFDKLRISQAPQHERMLIRLPQRPTEV
jgi:hypothetical protein